MSVNTKVNGQLVPSAGLYKVKVPIQSGDIYSFEERQVGVWTDGKPLYQKTYNVTFSSDAYVITIPSEIDIKTIIGGVDSANKTDFIHIGYGGGSSDSVQAYRTDATTLRFQNKYYSQRPNGEITIQYTKTTDVAGSGIWTPSGDYAEHYTTDEQVIGTYLGETLYQKTFHILKSDFTNTGTNTYSYSWSLPFNSIVSIDAIMNTNNAFVQIPNGTINQTYANYISSVTTSALGMYMNATSVYANLQYVDITLKYTKTS